MMTPAMVHYHQVTAVRDARQRTLDAAYSAHPARFVRRPPTTPSLANEVWINKPKSSPDDTH
jgi:putative transposase